MPKETAVLPSATILLVADEPWLYKSVRDGLGLTQVMRAASGVEYDVGIIPAENGVWNIILAADRVSSGEVLVADISSPLVVILKGEDDVVDSENLRGIKFSIFHSIATSEKRSGVTVPLPAALLRQADRFTLRGEVSARLPGAAFEFFQRGSQVSSRFHSMLKALAGAKTTQFALVHVTRRFLKATGWVVFPGKPLFTDVPGNVSSFLHMLFGGLPVTAFAVSQSSGAPLPPELIPTPHFTSVMGTLAGFQLDAVRMFESVTWPPVATRAGWHVVLGDNASGKTSLLRALALTLLHRAERDALRQDWSSWLRHDAQAGLIAVSIAADDATHVLSLALVRAGRNGNGAGVVDVRSSETLQYGGFLAAYGPFRRFTGGDTEWLSTFRAHPRTQRVITLFEERAALSDALEWLKDLWVRAETAKAAKPVPPEKRFLKQLLSFINDTGFLPPDVTLLEPDADGVWCRDGNGRRVLVIELSDGYRAALSLTLDLIRHLAVEYGHAKVFAKTKPLTVAADGIVLIDEPDAHLHPTWQQRIGEWFKRFFPRMQFVVTTHSPIVCQAADSVLLLPAPGNDAPARMASASELDRLRYGDVLDAFATDFFGRKVTRSEEGREKVQRLAMLNLKALQSGLDDDERQEQERLRGELGTAGEAPSVAAAS